MQLMDAEAHHWTGGIYTRAAPNLELLVGGAREPTACRAVVSSVTLGVVLLGRIWWGDLSVFAGTADHISQLRLIENAS
jgi:hypothetical protein